MSDIDTARPNRPPLPWRLLLTAGLALAGCNSSAALDRSFQTEQRLQNGLVVILPGIEGRGLFSQTVRDGLAGADIRQALQFYEWGWQVPLAGLVVNQVDTRRARAEGAKLARRIAHYQEEYPGRPVHLVGHSGGAAVAIFAVEQLPDNHVVDGVILLSPSLSGGYDLATALNRSCKGVVNFWSPGDVALLVLGTTILGNLDGVRGPAAGAVGFARPKDPELAGKLHQLQWSLAMVPSGHLGGHFTVTGPSFVTRWVAPWVQSRDWPAVAQPAPQTQPDTAPADADST